MPRVPETEYTPYTQIDTSDTATPMLRINATPDAFGANIGRAISSLGEGMQVDSNELYRTALEVQQLRNQSDANAAVAKTSQDIAMKHADYGNLRGKAAVDSLQPHLKDIEDIREENGKNLNPMAKRLYDNESRSITNRTMFSAAGHAATEGRSFALQTQSARVSIIKDGALANPGDINALDKSIQDAMEQVALNPKLTGFEGPELAQKQNEVASSIRSEWLKGHARDDPTMANDLMEQWVSEGKLLSQDYFKIKNEITNAVHNVGARNVSAASSRGFAPYATTTDMSRANGVDDALVRTFQNVQKQHPEVELHIGEYGGRRSLDIQKLMVARGVSQTLHSGHLDGTAMDIAIYKNGQYVKDDSNGDYTRLRQWMTEEGQKLNGVSFQAPISWDPYHFQLSKDYDRKSLPDKKEETLQPQVDRAVNYARQKYPNDPAFEEAIKKGVIGDYYTNKRITHDTMVDQYNNVLKGVDGLGTGKKPTSIDELKSQGPEVSAGLEYLQQNNPKEYRQVENLLTKNAKQDYVMTPVDQKRFEELYGMSYHDPDKFQQLNLTDEHLDNSHRMQLLKMQLRHYDRWQQDPKVTRALGILKRTFPNSIPEHSRDPDGANQFAGGLQTALEIFQQSHPGGQQPTEDEIKDMGKGLLQPVPNSGWFTDYKVYEEPTPSKFIDEVRKKNPNATDDEISNAYHFFRMRDNYTKLFSKQSIEGPSPPVSK